MPPRNGMISSVQRKKLLNRTGEYMNRKDIINKKFSHSFTGYDITEVDLFLDEIIREFDSRNHEKGLLEFKIEHEFDVALKYIRLLRKQLEEADIQSIEIPVSISDDLKELTEKEDAREKKENAQDNAIVSNIQAAIAASDRICTGEEKTSDALPENTEDEDRMPPAETAEKETAGKIPETDLSDAGKTIDETDKIIEKIEKEVGLTDETENGYPKVTNNYGTWFEEEKTENAEKPGNTETPDTDEKSSDRDAAAVNEEAEKNPTYDIAASDDVSSETEENGKHKKKKHQKKHPEGKKSKKRKDFSDYEEYDVNKN